MFLQGSRRRSCVTLFYLKPSSDSNIMHDRVDLYEAWNKPEEAEKWRAKLAQTEALEE